MSASSRGSKKEVSKELLGLAGEYAVASEICRRGFHAQITYGRWKNTDVLAVNLENGRAVLVEVKTKQGGEWPNIKGFKEPNKVQVFVDYGRKKEQERPDFYIVDEKFWQEHTKRVKEKYGDKVIIKEDQGVIKFDWVGQRYYGISIRPSDIAEYKERWDILVEKLRKQ